MTRGAQSRGIHDQELVFWILFSAASSISRISLGFLKASIVWKKEHYHISRHRSITQILEKGRLFKTCLVFGLAVSWVVLKGFFVLFCFFSFSELKSSIYVAHLDQELRNLGSRFNLLLSCFISSPRDQLWFPALRNSAAWYKKRAGSSGQSRCPFPLNISGSWNYVFFHQ